MTQIITRDGLAQEVDLSLDTLKAAYAEGKSLPQHLNTLYDTDEARHGTPFQQALATNGLIMQADRKYGLKPATLHSVLNGTSNVNMSTIVRPDGNGAQSVSGRLLFGAALLEMVESQLMDDNTAYEGVFNRMVATTSSVDSPRADQPIINLTAPRTSRSQPISQLSEPPTMVTITLSDKTIRIPTFSIGLEISDEAQKQTTVDLVGIALREQAMSERAARIDEGLIGMIAGDADLGISALSSINASGYDSTATSAALFSQRAFIKYLREDWKKLNLDWAICDLDGYLAMEGRVGKPIWTGNEGTDGRLNTAMVAANPGIPGSLNYFIVDSTVLGAANKATASNKVVGLDSRRAIRKVVYAGATYSAFEAYVMRRSTALRIDFAEGYWRLIDGAWKSMLLQ